MNFLPHDWGMEIVEPAQLSELDSLKKEISQTLFDYGLAIYELETKERAKAELSVKLHNLNEKAKKLQAQLHKEAQKEAMKVKLANPSGDPVYGGPAQ